VNLFIDWFFITFSLHVAFGTNRIIRSYELKKKSSSFISWLIDKNKGFEHSLKLGRSFCPGLGDFIVLKGLELLISPEKKSRIGWQINKEKIKPKVIWEWWKN